eukprot:CAMPEP_0183357516 /NCGR_PEP_ID=MMETSP0164_2-20130417/46528_1 /TAXON_ID=221442 /ORGANISM="Coccolithus pelagicus ssp braarudi, Strain PLY182g" /LENGTH=68 /DNA_ID=CAMNT_0025531151 /DNA_START=223 /DNA_END=429 /DNA_ORIENTATION=+
MSRQAEAQHTRRSVSGSSQPLLLRKMYSITTIALDLTSAIAHQSRMTAYSYHKAHKPPRANDRTQATS